ncbi:MAG: methylmalonyl Co-A mutase-associated GTPase MeaB, partial [Thermomicrobiaceae bacterium]|nr:methylmalonyl Co-A mutase-associated GTPase MeaB [Thermomicrobiaceae bacterium]
MSELIQRLLSGDRRALARLLSHVENRTELGREAVRA